MRTAAEETACQRVLRNCSQEVDGTTIYMVLLKEYVHSSTQLCGRSLTPQAMDTSVNDFRVFLVEEDVRSKFVKNLLKYF